ncbi:hypothetical protein [Calidithermus timidus]|jgi:hypothetical protein|uniref:hypothetical protein n=1 Tax=Calidithermus timidus TaxID=307124 RepID=UPI00036AEE88|nr:hypothetical protein [Calidithermus timidus]
MSLLGYGVDTFVFWLSWGDSYDLPASFQAALDAALSNFREHGEGRFLGINEYLPLWNPLGDASRGDYQVCEVQPGRKFRWRLMFQGGMLSVSLAHPRPTVRRTGQVQAYVEISGRYMMAAARDVDAVVAMIVQELSALVGAQPERVQVSRVDLFADILAPAPLGLDDLGRFVSRARSRSIWSSPAGAQAPQGGPLMGNTGAAMHETPAYEVHPVEIHYRGPSWSGFRFGAGDLLARVYSKSLQARTDYGAKLLLESYGNPEGHVIRVEYQVRADALATMDIGVGRDLRDWDILRGALGSLWAYLSREWLTLRESHGDAAVRNRGLDPLWLHVIAAFDAGSAGSVSRSVRAPLADAARLLTQAVGCVISAAASLGLYHSAPAPALLLAWLRRVRYLLGLDPSRIAALSTDEFSARYLSALGRYGGVAST